jgi:hypothetical protein
VLQLDDLPFQPGENVEAIVLPKVSSAPRPCSPVRGKVLAYTDPTEPVAESDWGLPP